MYDHESAMYQLLASEQDKHQELQADLRKLVEEMRKEGCQCYDHGIGCCAMTLQQWAKKIEEKLLVE